MLIKNNNTGKIHKAIYKGNYDSDMIKNAKYYSSLCNFINGDQIDISFIESDNNELINCEYCRKKLGLKNKEE